MRTKAPVVVIAGLLLSSLTLPALADAAVPSAVKKANRSVVRVERFGSPSRKAEKSAAFAIDDQGRFLTTTSAVAREPVMKVFVRGRSKPYRAQEVLNDAPPGLTLIQIIGRAPNLAPLVPAQSLPQDGTYWITAPPTAKSAPRTALSRPLRTELIDPPLSCSQAPGIKTVGATARLRTNGTPVLNGKGHFVGVVRADPPADPPNSAQCTYTQFLPASRVPAHLDRVPTPARSDFPAVTVVIGLAIALMLANAFFIFRRRKALYEPLLVTASEVPVQEPPVAAPMYPAEDDLEITLRPRDRPTRVSPSSKTTHVPRSPAATRVSKSPDPAPDEPDDDLGPITLH